MRTRYLDAFIFPHEYVEAVPPGSHGQIRAHYVTGFAKQFQRGLARRRKQNRILPASDANRACVKWKRHGSKSCRDEALENGDVGRGQFGHKGIIRRYVTTRTASRFPMRSEKRLRPPRDRLRPRAPRAPANRGWRAACKSILAAKHCSCGTEYASGRLRCRVEN